MNVLLRGVGKKYIFSFSCFYCTSKHVVVTFVVFFCSFCVFVLRLNIYYYQFYIIHAIYVDIVLSVSD